MDTWLQFCMVIVRGKLRTDRGSTSVHVGLASSTSSFVGTHCHRHRHLMSWERHFPREESDWGIVSVI